MNCPHCGKPVIAIVTLIKSAPGYDPSDLIQKRGFDDTEYNATVRPNGPFRNNPFPHGSDEYYRWNRGYHAFAQLK